MAYGVAGNLTRNHVHCMASSIVVQNWCCGVLQSTLGNRPSKMVTLRIETMIAPPAVMATCKDSPICHSNLRQAVLLVQ